MSVFNKCEVCGQIAQTVCECSSPPRFFCYPHVSDHMRSGGFHPFREAILPLSSEQISLLRQASNQYRKESIRKIILRRDELTNDLLRQLRKVERDHSKEIENILKEQYSIEEACAFGGLPVICDSPLISSLASLRIVSMFTYQEILQIFHSFPSSSSSSSSRPPSSLQSLSSTLQSPSPPRWKLLQKFQAHDKPIRSLAVSDCERYLASGSEDNTIKIWDLESFEYIYSLIGHTDWVRSVAFWGNKLISGSSDKTIKIWEGDGCSDTLSLHSDWVRSVRISSCKRLLASGGDDMKAFIYDLPQKKTLHSLSHSAEVNSVVFSPSDKQIVSASQDSIRVWNTYTGKLLKTLNGHSNPVTCLCFLGNLLVSSSCDNNLRIWDLEKEGTNRTLKGHSKYVVGVEGKGNILVSLGHDNSLKVWDIRSGECIQTLEGHGDYNQDNRWWSMDLKILKEGHYIVSGGRDKNIKIFRKVN